MISAGDSVATTLFHRSISNATARASLRCSSNLNAVCSAASRHCRGSFAEFLKCGDDAASIARGAAHVQEQGDAREGAPHPPNRRLPQVAHAPWHGYFWTQYPPDRENRYSTLENYLPTPVSPYLCTSKFGNVQKSSVTLYKNSKTIREIQFRRISINISSSEAALAMALRAGSR